MLINFALRAKVLVLIGAVFAILGVGEVTAQNQNQGDRRQAQPRRGQAQPRPQQSEPFIHGITVGIGLAVYQGDLSRNPNHNPVKYIAGNGNLSVKVGADHRLGRFDQFGLGADLVYSRLSGQSVNQGFSAHTVALHLYGDYELPYVSQGLFRVFLGGGPNLIISPSYDNFPGDQEVPSFLSPDAFQEKGTRPVGSLKIGVTILDKFQIGTRMSSSDLLDGYKGFSSDGIPDFVSFINFTYRFDMKN